MESKIMYVVYSIYIYMFFLDIAGQNDRRIRDMIQGFINVPTI